MHNMQSAMVAADGIRKMNAVYSDAVFAKEPDLSEIGKAIWRILQELVALIATNFLKIVFPGFVVERVYGTLVVRDEKENDLLSVYDGQINDGIVHDKQLGEINLKENPEVIAKILPPEILFYLLSYDERIDLDELINRQHKIIQNKKHLYELHDFFPELPTLEDKALWLVTRCKLEQEIEKLKTIDVSDDRRNFDRDCQYNKNVLDEYFGNDDSEPYYVDLDDIRDMDRFPDIC